MKIHDTTRHYYSHLFLDCGPDKIFLSAPLMLPKTYEIFNANRYRLVQLIRSQSSNNTYSYIIVKVITKLKCGLFDQANMHSYG